ncbi:hypothetical protein [Agrobacterium vitis]|uniref:hypothetical protein n=1 Tax=Agrobacterium vitis TaxID=373 RepID=UPI001576AF80|nr:hypothetical protein G6L01_021025 [Agrobacterium vitis]
MHKYQILVSLAVLLSSCQSQMRVLEAGGDIRVEPSTIAGSDYAVHLRNTIDFGYDPDVKANREKFALGILKKQCPTGKIVNENVIVTGTYLSGSPSRVYTVYVKCNG